MVVSDQDEDDAVRGDHPPGLGDFLVNGPAGANVLVWVQVFPFNDNNVNFLESSTALPSLKKSPV